MHNRLLIAVVAGWASGLIACAESAIRAPTPEGGVDAPPFELDASGVFAEGSSSSDAVRSSDAGRGGSRDASSATGDAGLGLDAMLGAPEAAAPAQDAAPIANPPADQSATQADSGAPDSAAPAVTAPAPTVADAGAPACAPELRQCGTECIDVRASVAHCGECGRACAAGESCTDGSCVAPAPPPPALPTPPAGCSTQSFEGRYYFFCSQALSWRDARSACIDAGMELAIVDSAAENEFVRANGASWIGVSDVDAEGDFRAPVPGVLEQSNGAALPFTSWAAGEPNNLQHCDGLTVLDTCFGETSDEDCGLLQLDGSWIDLQCSRGNAYVCEAR